jgi:hypothetical protein
MFLRKSSEEFRFFSDIEFAECSELRILWSQAVFRRFGLLGANRCPMTMPNSMSVNYAAAGAFGYAPASMHAIYAGCETYHGWLLRAPSFALPNAA